MTRREILWAYRHEARRWPELLRRGHGLRFVEPVAAQLARHEAGVPTILRRGRDFGRGEPTWIVRRRSTR